MTPLSYRHGRATSRPLAADRLDDDSALPLLAGLAFMGGLIHVGAAVDHASEVPAYAPAFLAVALAQFAWAFLVWRGPTRRVLLVGSALSFGVLFVWAASRTVGVPFGPHPWRPERVGLADVVESADELVAAVVAIALATSRSSAAARRTLELARPAMLVFLLLSMLYGVGAHAS
jgi:hypothetical protein